MNLNNKEDVLKILEKTDDIYDFLNEDLQKDRDIVLMRLRRDYIELKDLNGKFKDDKEIVLEGIERSYKKDVTDDFFYENVGENLRTDNDILKSIACKNYSLYSKIDKENKKEILIKALTDDRLFMPEEELLKNSDLSLKDDKDVAFAAVKNSGLLFKFVSERLRDDRDIFLSAIMKNCSWGKKIGETCKYELDKNFDFSKNAKDFINKEILPFAGSTIQEEVKKAGGVTKWIENIVEKNNLGFLQKGEITKVVKNNIYTKEYKFFEDNIKKKNIYIKDGKKWQTYSFFTYFNNDKTSIMHEIKFCNNYHHYVFGSINEELKKDPEIISTLLKKDPKCINLIDKNIQEEVKEAGGVDKWIKQQEEPSNKKRKPIDNQVEIDTDKQNEK